MKQLQLTLNCEIEKFRSGETYYCTYKEYDLTEKSIVNFDEAEEKLINSIHSFIEQETWNKNLKVEFKINYKT